MVNRGILQSEGNNYRLVGISMKLSPLQEKNKNKLWSIIEGKRFSPPTYGETSELLGKELLQGLIGNGDLVRVSEEIIFRKTEFDLMLEYVNKELS